VYTGKEKGCLVFCVPVFFPEPTLLEGAAGGPYFGEGSDPAGLASEKESTLVYPSYFLFEYFLFELAEKYTIFSQFVPFVQQWEKRSDMTNWITLQRKPLFRY